MHKVAAAISLVAAGLAACAPTAATTRSKDPRHGAKQVTVLYVADLHAQLDEHPELFWRDGRERLERAGGFGRVAQAISRIRAERGGEVLVLDAGDTFQGSGVAALSEGAALVPALNAMGFDAAVPGNWEVVYGPSVLQQRARELNYPLFAANVRKADGGERLFAPWFTKELAGVTVTVVGFTDPDVPRRQPPAYSRGLSYDDADTLPDVVKRARAETKADVVLLLSHIGLSKAVALTEKLPGIDAHLSGDTHERTYQPIERNGVWTVEPGAFGSFLGRLDLWVADGKVVDRRWELIELTADGFGSDPRVDALVAKAEAPYAEQLHRPVGALPETVMRYEVVETSLDRLISDALREAGGTQVGLSNGFRFGTPLVPGPVREADLWNVLPISNKLKTGKVTGRQLRAFWEQELENVFAADPAKRFGGWLPRPSGLTLTFNAKAPKGQRLVSLEIAGAPVRDDQLYTLTACEREGDAPDTVCRIPHVKDVRVLELDAHEAVRRYLAKHREVPHDVRARALDLPRGVRSQDAR